MYGKIIFLVYIFSINSFAGSYDYLTEDNCQKCSFKINAKEVKVHYSWKIISSEERQLHRVEIDDKSYVLENAESVSPDNPANLYKVDINSDGYADLAIQHRSGTSNRYFHYFLYDQKANQYHHLGEFPELLIEKNEISSAERNGENSIVTKYKVVNNKLIKKK